jgi:hypothetical protein
MQKRCEAGSIALTGTIKRPSPYWSGLTEKRRPDCSMGVGEFSSWLAKNFSDSKEEKNGTSPTIL